MAELKSLVFYVAELESLLFYVAELKSLVFYVAELKSLVFSQKFSLIYSFYFTFIFANEIKISIVINLVKLSI